MIEASFVVARTLLDEIITAGIAAGEFDLKGFDTDVVLRFLLHGYVGPCYYHTDPDTAVYNVKQLFRRAIGVKL